jgi:hypothetical protein
VCGCFEQESPGNSVVFVSVCLSICVYVRRLPVYLCVCPSVCLSICVYVRLSVCVPLFDALSLSLIPCIPCATPLSRVRICILAYTYTHTYIYVHTYMTTRSHTKQVAHGLNTYDRLKDADMYTCIHIHTYIYIHTNTYMNPRSHTKQVAHGLSTYDRLKDDILQPPVGECVHEGRVSVIHMEKVFILNMCMCVSVSVCVCVCVCVYIYIYIYIYETSHSNIIW